MYDITINQSGVIPFFSEDGIIKYVLIRSNMSRTFIFPKGMIEIDMTPQESAAQEALEEVGLTGTVFENSVGRYHYQKFGLDLSVDLYPFLVENIMETWDEPWRDRQILDFETALETIDDRLKNILRQFQPLALKLIQNR